MSKHISFPAEHISAYEIGKRLRAITKEGAKVEDVVKALRVIAGGEGKPNRIFLWFQNVPANSYDDRGFEILPDQMVKRIDDDEA
jgi:hypothetical protein